MARRLLSYDPMTGVSTYHSYDHQTNQTIIQTVQDVEPIIEANKYASNNEDKQKQIKKGFWRVASIPIGVQHKWLVDHGVDIYNRDHWPKIKKLLQDPDYRYLKTTTGRF